MMNNRFRILLVPVLIIGFFGLFACNPTKIANRQFAQAKLKKPYDLLVVPGFPFNPEHGWHPILKNRLLWSVYLMKHGFADCVIYSGSAVYTPYSEGKIMALLAIELGVPREKILIEDRAEHSVENIYYAHLLANEHQWKSIAVGTDINQSLRFKQYRRYSRIMYDIIPMMVDSVDFSVAQPDIDFQSAYVKGFISITERKKSWQMFRDSGGRHLPKEKRKGR